MTYLVSAILPTRGRFELCCRSIDSLFSTAINPDSIEVLIGYDNDDIEAANKLKEYYKNKENIRFFEYPRYGYKYLNKYVNDLSLKSNGQWLFLWNDDAIMETYGWDEYILSYEDRFCCICPMSNIGYTGLFPLIPKKWVELTGHFAQNCSNDTWVEDIARTVGIYVDEYRINIMHDRGDLTGNNKDSTFCERVYDTEYYYSEEQKAMRQIDANKISEYLKEIKTLH